MDTDGLWPSLLQTSDSQVGFRSHEWAQPASATRTCKARAFLDLSLTARPCPARGRYVDRWPDSRTEPVGSILFIPPGMTLSATHGAGTQRSLSCFIDSRIFGNELDDLSDRAMTECLNVRNADVLRGMQRLARETANPGPVGPVMQEALLITLSVDLLRHLKSMTASETGASGLSPWRMRLIEERIRSQEPLPKVSELAAICRMSTRHLARAFRNETGATLRDRIKNAGIARAEQLLAEGRMPIKQIAAQLGFASTSSFSSAYVRATGDRPKDARSRGAG